MTPREESAAKIERLRAVMRRRGLDAAVLQRRDNFAWITAGGINAVNSAAESGVAAILITHDRAALLANNIERQRILDEQLTALDLPSHEFAWPQPGGMIEAARTILGPCRIGADIPGFDHLIADDLRTLRLTLLDAEIVRYRTHGRMIVEGIETAARSLRPTMTEHEAAGELMRQLVRRGMRVAVCLVAGDRRVMVRRHPLPTDAPLGRRAMLSAVAESCGLYAAVTRLVAFDPPDAEMIRRHRAVCEVFASAVAATRPGRTRADVLADIFNEYRRQGFDGEPMLHHQGGPIGYNPREAIATPGSDELVEPRQAFAWNPTITGTKCEETILVTDRGVEWVTQPGDDWPTLDIARPGFAARLADVIFLGHF